MNDILTLRQAADLFKIDCTSSKINPTRKIQTFLANIETLRGVKILYKSNKRDFYTTMAALRTAIPEAFQDNYKHISNNEIEEAKEDVSEETLDIIKELACSLKTKMRRLEANNKNMQEQLINLNNKYNILEDKYQTLSKKTYLAKNKTVPTAENNKD